MFTTISIQLQVPLNLHIFLSFQWNKIVKIVVKNIFIYYYYFDPNFVLSLCLFLFPCEKKLTTLKALES